MEPKSITKKKRKKIVKQKSTFKNFQEEEDLVNWVKAKIYDILKGSLLDIVKLDIELAPQDILNKDQNGTYAFSINYNHVYKRGHLLIYPVVLKHFKKEPNWEEKLTEGLIHEVSHIYTEKLSLLTKKRFIREEEVDEACEELTETMARFMASHLKLKNLNNKSN